MHSHRTCMVKFQFYDWRATHVTYNKSTPTLDSIAAGTMEHPENITYDNTDMIDIETT